MLRAYLVDMLAINDNYNFVLHDDVANITAVVDPSQAEGILAFLEGKGWALNYILSTHHHWDHVNGNLALKQATGCKVVGFVGDAHRIPGIDIELQEHEHFALGEHDAAIMLLPGHVKGHIGYYFAKAKMLFSGDVLFSMGCGRIFEGNADEFYESFCKIAALPDDTAIYAAHEYTLANGRFARKCEPNNPAIEAYMVECKDKRKHGEPTIPTLLSTEKAVNPFMRTHSTGIREFLGMQDATNAQVFGALRQQKDHFKS